MTFSPFFVGSIHPSCVYIKKSVFKFNSRNFCKPMDANLINSLLNDVNEALKTAKDKLKQINSDGSIETYEKLCSEMFTSEFQIRIPSNLFENIINPEKFTCALNATIELKKLYKRGQMAVKNRLLKKLKIPRNPFLPRSVAYRKLDINDNESTAQHTDCLELDDASLEDEINQQLLQLSNDKVQVHVFCFVNIKVSQVFVLCAGNFSK